MGLDDRACCGDEAINTGDVLLAVVITGEIDVCIADCNCNCSSEIEREISVRAVVRELWLRGGYLQEFQLCMATRRWQH